MNLNVYRPSKKILLFVVAGIIGIALGSFATYGILKDDLNRSTINTDGSTNNEQSKQALFEEKLPDGTISPKSINSDSGQYMNKVIQVRGILIERSAGNYFVAGQEQNRPGTLNLDVATNNVDVSKYVGGYTDTKNLANKNPSTTGIQPGPVTITGKLITQSNKLTLIVTKIQR